MKPEFFVLLRERGGKTAAFGIGILQHLNPTYFAVQALVLCPTRELAMQVADHARELAANTPGRGNGTSGSTAGAGAVSAIATGGKRSTTINISLGALVDKLVFEGGYEGSRDDMQRDLENRLIQVLQMAATAQ